MSTICAYCLRLQRYNELACGTCKGWMAQGIILISFDPVRTLHDHDPYRSGGWTVVRDDFVREKLFGQVLRDVLFRRVAYLDDSTWDRWQLPRATLDSKKKKGWITTWVTDSK